jgi:hypothetical protein
MYLWIPWKLFADPKGSAEQTFGTTNLDEGQFASGRVTYLLQQK